MRIIDEGLFIKLLPDEGMILTGKATETMRAEEIDLGKSDSADNYKDIPIEPETDIPVEADSNPEPDLTVSDTLEMLSEMGVDTDD